MINSYLFPLAGHQYSLFAGQAQDIPLPTCQIWSVLWHPATAESQWLEQKRDIPVLKLPLFRELFFPSVCFPKEEVFAGQRGFPLACPSAFHYLSEVIWGAGLYTVLYYMQRCSDLIYSLLLDKDYCSCVFWKTINEGSSAHTTHFQ